MCGGRYFRDYIRSSLNVALNHPHGLAHVLDGFPGADPFPLGAGHRLLTSPKSELLRSHRSGFVFWVVLRFAGVGRGYDNYVDAAVIGDLAVEGRYGVAGNNGHYRNAIQLFD